MIVRILKSVGIAALVAAAAVPSALAMRAGQEFAGPLGSTDTSVKAVGDTSPSFSQYLAGHASQPGGTAVTQLSTRPDDRAGVRTSTPTQIVPATGSGDGFAWGNAGIGAGGALGLLLVLALGAGLVRRGRKGPLAA